MFSVSSTFLDVLFASSLFQVLITANSIEKLLGVSPNRLRYLDSSTAPGATISYKQTSICETTPGVKAFSGYINLPNNLLEGYGGSSLYNASIFFWYIGK
jgi:hypothetical protein